MAYRMRSRRSRRADRITSLEILKPQGADAPQGNSAGEAKASILADGIAATAALTDELGGILNEASTTQANDDLSSLLEMSPPPLNPRPPGSPDAVPPAAAGGAAAARRPGPSLERPVYRAVPPDAHAARPAPATGPESSAGPARTASSPIAPEAPVPSLPPEPVCPFCGMVNESNSARCPRCTMENTPVTRQATQAKLGGWFVYQQRNPATPGMNFATLLALIQRSRVTRKSIVRGPTTGQFWRYAARVKGISREFGICWNCGGSIQRSARLCPRCKHLQEPPINPDVLLETEPLQSPAPAAPSAHATAPAPPAPSASPESRAGPGPDRLGDEPAPHAPSAPPLSAASPSSPPPSPLSRAAAAPAKPVPSSHSADVMRGSVAPANNANHMLVIDMGDLDDQTLVTRPELAAFNLPHDYALGTRPRRVLKGVLLALFLAAFSFGLLIYFNPPLGEKYLAWGKSLVAKLSSLTHARASTVPPARTPAADAARPDETATPSAPAAYQPKPPPESTPPVNRTTTHTATPNRTLANAPLPVSPPPPSPPTSDVVVPRAASETNHPPATAAQPAPPLPAPTRPEAASDAENAMDLWRAAIASEQKGDYAQAIRLFEKLKTLPQSVWPPGLEIRLELAKAQLGKTSAPRDGK